MASYCIKTDTFKTDDLASELDIISRDLEAIGQHCSICNLKDFCPITCLFCKNIFCGTCDENHRARCMDLKSPTSLRSSQSSSSSLSSSPEKKKKKCKYDIGNGVLCKNEVGYPEQCICTMCGRFSCIPHAQPYNHNCEAQKKKDTDERDKRITARV